MELIYKITCTDKGKGIRKLITGSISSYAAIYHISRNIDNDFNLAIWRMHQDCQINLRHYQSIYTTGMGFSPYSTEICQFKIPPTALFEQTAKYNIRQYFCLYGI